MSKSNKNCIINKRKYRIIDQWKFSSRLSIPRYSSRKNDRPQCFLTRILIQFLHLRFFYEYQKYMLPIILCIPSGSIFFPKSFSDLLWTFLKISFSWTAFFTDTFLEHSEHNEIGPWKISSEEATFDRSNDRKINFNGWLKGNNIEKKISNKSINAKPNFRTDKCYLSRAIKQPVEITRRKTDRVIN